MKKVSKILAIILIMAWAVMLVLTSLDYADLISLNGRIVDVVVGLLWIYTGFTCVLVICAVLFDRKERI